MKEQILPVFPVIPPRLCGYTTYASEIK